MTAMIARTYFLRALVALTIALTTALPLAGALARVQVSAVRLGSHPDDVTRVVMDVSDNLVFDAATESAPDRIVLHTGELDWKDAKAAQRSFGLVRGLRYVDGRILVDLKEPALVKSSYMLSPRDGLGWRLVVDVQKTSRTAFLAAARPVKTASFTTLDKTPAPPPPQARAIVVYSPAVTPPEHPAPAPVAAPAPAPVAAPAPAPVTAPAPVAEPTPVQLAPSAPAPRPQVTASGAPLLSAPVPPPLPRPVAVTNPSPSPSPEPVASEPVVPALAAKVELAAITAPAPAPEQAPTPRNRGKAVIVIDPGHGGVDPGAVGVSGVYEKHITLAMARELKKQLERSGHYKVHLTRDRDVFIRLRERVGIARQYGADLFISLHADSVPNSQLEGLSVYTLSQTASDGEAQSLADKENKADLIAGIDLSHESADVANILIDLAQRETMNRSAGFAGGVVDELGRETTLLGNTHRFAGFAVLKAPDVPSILVELGYLSNATEERQLRQPDYRTKLARGIARAVDHYFLEGQKARRP